MIEIQKNKNKGAKKMANTVIKSNDTEENYFIHYHLIKKESSDNTHTTMYCISVKKFNNSGELIEQSTVDNLTKDIKKANLIIEILRSNSVTPCTLNCICSDLLHK